MPPLRIGMILADRESLPDIRVSKQARALIAAGYEVGLLAGGDQNLDHGDAAPEGVQVYRAQTPILSIAGLMPRPKPRLLLAGLHRAEHSAAFWARASGLEGLRFHLDGVSESWADTIRHFVRVFEPDVLHAHDLIILPTAMRVACGANLPVVADLHENWPAYLESLADAARGATRVGLDLIWNPSRWRELEEVLLPRCARVIVVVPEAKKRMATYGLDADAVVVVSNTESPARSRPTALPGFEDRWVALYAGSVDHARGVDTIVRALPELAAAAPEVLLLVVGANAEWQDRLSRLARELGVARNLRVEGWVPAEAIPSYVAASRACLVPHLGSEHTHTTVPHKLFQYMAAGKPVVASDCVPLARIISTTGAGTLFRAGSPTDAARAMLELIRDPVAADAMAKRGIAAVAGSLGWQQDARRLVELYATVAARR